MQWTKKIILLLSLLLFPGCGPVMEFILQNEDKIETAKRLAEGSGSLAGIVLGGVFGMTLVGAAIYKKMRGGK